VVFNAGMTDSEIISHHGGATKFARLLGLTKPGSVQRVFNWQRRGIPAEVKLQHPQIFGITLDKERPELEANNPNSGINT
jgi:hypothetical protein